MSEPVRLTIIIVSFVIIGGAALALLLFMLIFPLLNRLFGIRLPSFRYGEAEIEEEHPEEEKKTKSKSAKPAEKSAPAKPAPKSAPARTVSTRFAPRVLAKSAPEAEDKKTEPANPAPKKSAPEAPLKPAPEAEEKKAGPARSAVKKSAPPASLKPASATPTEDEKAEPASSAAVPAPRAPRAPDFHKDIPTVRVDTLFAPASNEKPLTAAKIEAEGRRATRTEKTAPGGSQSKADAPAPVKKPVIRKKPAQGEPETVEIGGNPKKK